MPRAWRRADLRPVPLLNFVASHTTYFSGQMEQFLLGLRRPSVGPEVYEEDVEFQLIDILEVNTLCRASQPTKTVKVAKGAFVHELCSIRHYA